MKMGQHARIACLAVLTLAGCGSTRIEPTPLTPVAQNVGLGQEWQSTVDASIVFPLQTGIAAERVALANSKGLVSVVSAVNGANVWRIQLDAQISSGVGFDGQTAAVTTLDNDLIAMTQSSTKRPVVAWKKRMLARVYTAPLVAGGRVFVLAGDRSVQAFDAETGAKLWYLPRPPEPLVLSQAGTLGIYKNTLLVGNSGRLLGVNPDSGQVMWELTVATSRGTNDIERLIELVGAPSRVGDSVCVRSYQTAVACVDMIERKLVWSKPAQGFTSVSGDAQIVAGTESDGRVKVWSRTNGDLLWSSDQLMYRKLSAPLVVGSSIIVGDFEGYVHVMNKTTGEFTTRFKTDGTAVVAAPAIVGDTVVVATAKGGVFAFSPK